MGRDKPPESRTDFFSKVPQVTLAFWVIKILATTVGETGGDAVSMTPNLGYAVSRPILTEYLGFQGSIANCTEFIDGQLSC